MTASLLTRLLTPLFTGGVTSLLMGRFKSFKGLPLQLQQMVGTTLLTDGEWVNQVTVLTLQNGQLTIQTEVDIL
jgi:hypothetical protein